MTSPVDKGEFLLVANLTNEIECSPASVSLLINGMEILFKYETDETLLGKVLSLLESRA